LRASFRLPSSFGNARWHHRHTAQRGCLGTCAPSTHRSRSARKGLPARERLLLLAAFPFSRCQLSLLVLGRSFKPPFHIEHHPLLWGMLANSTHQELMGDVVEEAFDIQIKHPVIFPA